MEAAALGAWPRQLEHDTVRDMANGQFQSAGGASFELKRKYYACLIPMHFKQQFHTNIGSFPSLRAS